MKISYTHKESNQRLLLVYAGWSTDESAFRALRCPGYDIAVVSDYSELNPLEITGYSEVVLLAWSLGVHAAELTAGRLPLTLTIAVCGTPTPVNDLTGIPEAIWRATAEGLSEASLTKFRRRMGAASLERGPRTIESLRAELLAFPTAPVDFRWDRAIIATDDRIFPPANQLRAWQGRAEITEIAGPHTPDFQQIVDRFVINKTLVGSRFAKGLPTYDGAADVQHRIADHLFSLWQKHGLQTSSVLEIGVGSGYFTSLYARKLRNAAITLWDIAPASDQVVEADAESALPAVSGHFGAIVSASTMQWFNSQAAFLRQVARVLESGGLAVLSTFGPETFRELSAAGVVGLPYLPEAALKRIVPADFDILELHSGLIVKSFPEPVDVFRHLRSTGVNARHSARPLSEILSAYPRVDGGRCELTYQPVYLILRKK